MKTLLASGEYEQAVDSANAYLKRHPDDEAVKALASEALLKARVPGWLAALQARQFDRASALIGGMKSSGEGNADTVPLIEELRWVGDLERFFVGRGGADAPIRLYGDEDRIDRLLKHWDEDPKSTPARARPDCILRAAIRGSLCNGA